MSFANKVVIVTGASSGIGAATAISFAKELAKVVIVGRNEVKLKNVAEQCTVNNTQPLIIKADVSDDNAAKTIIQRTVDHFGKIDVLVNNAGMSSSGSLLDGTFLEAYDIVMKTNLRAVVHLTSLAAKHLVATKGNVINISSVGSLHTPQVPQQGAYCVAKAGLDHFTRCAALELAGSGVRVNVVNPGPVKTDILENSGIPNPDAVWERFKGVPLNKLAYPEEVADLILFLAGDKAKSITGSSFVLDNGFLLKH